VRADVTATTGPAVASHTVSVEPAGVSFTARGDETILAAARRGGEWLPFECGWGSCGTCKLTLLEGRTRTLFDQAPCLREQDRRRSRILACQSCPESDLVVETRRSLAQREDLPTADYQGTLMAIEQLAPDIRQLHFSLDRPADFLPGQYAMVEPEPGLRRAYSMTGLPGRHSVEFLIKRYEQGPGTKRLFELCPGAVVPIELPFGAAYYRSREQPPVFVAGGTGIAPIVSMLKSLAAGGGHDAGSACVLYGARTIDELVLMHELESLCDALQASLVPVLEQPPPDWTGARGFVTDVMGGWLPGDWTDLRYYVAGPPPMVEATLRLLNEAGVQVTRIHHDSFG
jgi:toluene monooxygenase electron transfer component